MKNPFSPGDTKTFSHVVGPDDTARFPTGEVHPVYSTFALAREAEWSGRQFVLGMKEADEEGIGTGITVTHHSPAGIGQEVAFTATLIAVQGNEVVTGYKATVGARLIADGEQRQKILKSERLKQLFARMA